MSKYINFHEKYQALKQKGKGGGSSVNGQVAKLAQQATFKPFTVTTGSGTAYGNADNQYGATASDQYSNIQQQALGGTNQLLPSLTNALGQQPQQFGFNSNIDQLSQNYFNQQAAMLQPAFAQQNAALQSDLFGGGRLGLRLASEGAGAGQGGFVQPDAFGLGRAQSQTLADVAGQSRQQAMQEAQGRYGLESGVFGINQQGQQQYTQNLLGGAQGLFGMGTGVSDVENQLLQLGLSAEQARSVAAAQAASAMASGQEQEKDGKGFLGSLVGAAGQVGAAYVTGGTSAAAGSDRRLKSNIDYVDTDALGLKWYTWDWNDIAKDLGISVDPEYGVIAQEVREIFPEAISEGSDGYLRVNYKMLADKLAEAK